MPNGGLLLRRVMVRHLFIVGRAHPDLFDFLAKRFADDPNVVVILDRRVADRRHALTPQLPLGMDRRRGIDRRSRPSVDEELKVRSHAIITLPD